MKMKTLIYQVYTGKKSRLYDHCTYSVAEYAERIGAEYIQQKQPILKIKPDVFATNRSKESYEKYGGFLPIYEKESQHSTCDFAVPANPLEALEMLLYHCCTRDLP